MKLPRLRRAVPVVCDPIDRVVAPAPGWLRICSRTVGGIQLLYAGFFGWAVSPVLRGGRFCNHASYGKGEYFPAYLDWDWLFYVTDLPLLALAGFVGGCGLLFLRPWARRWEIAYLITILALSVETVVMIELSSQISHQIELEFIVISLSSSALALPYLPFLFTSVATAMTRVSVRPVPGDERFAMAPDGVTDPALIGSLGEVSDVGSHRGKRVPIIAIIAAFLIGWFGFLTAREYVLAREDKPFLMKLTPASGGCLVRFYQAGGGVASPEFTVDLPVEGPLPLDFELRSGKTRIPGCTVEFCGTTLLPKRCRLRVGETLFYLTEDRIEVGGRMCRWIGRD